MSLSTIVKQECSVCGKQAVEKSRLKIGDSTLITLVCGHLASYKSHEIKDDNVYGDIVFSDGKSPRPYQIDCIKFGERNNFNIIIADQQGLGKTIEIGCMVRLHPEELLPLIYVSPVSVKLQVFREFQRICQPTGSREEKQRFLTQVISSGKEKAMPGFQIYIVSFDMLKNDGMFDFVDEIKTIVIDECQNIKNHLSDRAKAVQKIAKRAKHIIPMSGTPIKNHAGEYFTVLNLVDPRRFPNYQRYIDTYCDSYNNGWALKVGGLKDPARFKADTEHMIIRRTKEEVLKDLPAKERKFYHVELDPKLNKAYAAALKELDDLMYDDMSSFERATATIAIMSRLRHITGVSKVEECVDWTVDFLTSCERKLVIFTHHDDTAQILQGKMDAWLGENGMGSCVRMHSGLNGDERTRLVDRFREEPIRLMIASTQATGVGLNLQFCSDAVMLERQWNPPNEEQAEDRFHRFGQENHVSITYMIASGTIDEYFTELVESKRAIIAGALDGKEVKWDQNSLMKELAELLVMKGRDKWRL